jgi:hypothetical protein
VVQRGEPPGESRAWPERWPVLGPLIGAAMALCATVAAAIEGDWIAGTIFIVLATVLGAVADRNRKIEQADAHSSTAPARDATLRCSPDVPDE